jgi:group II intron reverse transcriptase/maturase
MDCSRETLILQQREWEMGTKLEQIAKLAETDPQKVFTSIAHLIDGDCLTRSFRKLRRWAATGIDKKSYSDYEQDLEANIHDLYQRLKSGTYKAPNIRRTWIPKGDGKSQRPLGISTIEDKIVQRAVSDLLSVIYEADFSRHSYGFRKEKSPHHALAYIRKRSMQYPFRWLIDADIKSCFDSFDHRIIMEIMKKRVNDGSILKLINQWMKAGVIDGKQIFNPESGVPQGNIISPLLSNISLHEILDQWIEEIRPMLEGELFFTRFADDFVIGLEYKEDAQRVYQTLPKRFHKYGLTIHPEKTRLINFSPENNGDSRTFDFLGFTHYWTKSKRGFDVIKRVTKCAKANRIYHAMYEYCRDNRHLRIREQWTELCMKIRGYYAYFAIPGNYNFLQQVYQHAIHYWFKWLNRRSQYNSYTWEGYENLLKVFPLPRPRIIHKNV